MVDHDIPATDGFAGAKVEYNRLPPPVHDAYLAAMEGSIKPSYVCRRLKKISGQRVNRVPCQCGPPVVGVGLRNFLFPRVKKNKKDGDAVEAFRRASVVRVEDEDHQFGNSPSPRRRRSHDHSISTAAGCRRSLASRHAPRVPIPWGGSRFGRVPEAARCAARVRAAATIRGGLGCASAVREEENDSCRVVSRVQRCRLPFHPPAGEREPKGCCNSGLPRSAPCYRGVALADTELGRRCVLVCTVTVNVFFDILCKGTAAAECRQAMCFGKSYYDCDASYLAAKLQLYPSWHV